MLLHKHSMMLLHTLRSPGSPTLRSKSRIRGSRQTRSYTNPASSLAKLPATSNCPRQQPASPMRDVRLRMAGPGVLPSRFHSEHEGHSPENRVLAPSRACCSFALRTSTPVLSPRAGQGRYRLTEVCCWTRLTGFRCSGAELSLHHRPCRRDFLRCPWEASGSGQPRSVCGSCCMEALPFPSQ